VERVQGNVLDENALCAAFAGADVVYHLAAVISITGAQGGAVDAVNVGGTRNVVAACRKQGVRRVVHFSSVHALQQTPLDTPLDETRPPAAGPRVLAYDRAKAAGEAVVREAARNGLDAVIVYPTAILGPLDFRGSEMGGVIAKLYHGHMPALVAAGFDWVDVRDIAAGAMAAEKLGVSGEGYLLSGQWTTLLELGELVHRFGGARPPRFIASLGLATVGAPFMEAWSTITHQQPLYTRDSLNVLRHSNRNVRHDKAARDLGYVPRTLADTVRDTVAWLTTGGAR